MQSNVVRLLLPFLLFCVAFLWPHTYLRAQAQGYNSSLTGVVSDNTGSTVPRAKVTLSNPDKGLTRTFPTGQDGVYVFTLVPPGTYTLTVEKSGFQTYVQSGIDLASGQVATQNVSLQVGAVTQEITVTGSAAMLNTTDANVSLDVTARQVTELPLNQRHIFSLILVNPFVNNSYAVQALNGPGSQGMADQDMYFLTVGGGRVGSTAAMVDGVWDVGPDWGGFMYIPSVDSTQELKVQTNSFSAQYGWSTGNILSAVTKSGTRDFHGVVYEFIRNYDLDSQNFFANLEGLAKPAFRRNQFGTSLGGPLYIPKLYEHRDKTFIFGDYEGLRASSPITGIFTVPTPAMKTGDFSALLGNSIGADCLGRPELKGQIYNPFTTRAITAGQIDPTSGLQATCTGYIRDPFAGNIIPPGLLDPTAKIAQQYWPTPTSSGIANNYAFTGPAPTNQDQYSIRVDQNISDKSRFFARWAQKREFKQEYADTFGANDPGGSGNIALDNRWEMNADYTRTFNPTLVMSVNFGVVRWAEGNVVQGHPYNIATFGPNFAALTPNSNQFPNITVDGIAPLATGSGYGSYPRNDGSVSVDVTKVHGPHNVTMGFMEVVQQDLGGRPDQSNFNFPQAMTEGADPTLGDTQTGFGFASFMLGTGNSGATGIVNFGAFERRMFGWYFQDNWKATRKLTLNLGIRYDFQPGPTERHNGTQWFNFTAPNPIGQDVGFTVPGELVFVGPPEGRGVYAGQKTNVSPRIGLAYQVSNKLAMRMGFGNFYAQAYELSPPNDGFSQNTPYEGTVDGITPVNLFSNPFPSGVTPPPGRSLGGLQDVGISPTAIEHWRPTPYVMEWMLSLQYEFARNSMFDVTYLGNHGLKLPFSSVEHNQLPTQDLAMGDALLNLVPNPFARYIASSGCGLNESTVTAGQLLRPYPEYCGVGDSQMPGAFSTYNAMAVTFTHRWSQGIMFVASYALSKYITNSDGQVAWAATNNDYIRNNYNYYAEKSLSGSDIPQSLVMNYIYQLPVGRGRHFASGMNRAADAVLGGWQVSGITTFKSGFPLCITDDTNNTNSFGGGQRPNLVGNPHLAHPSIYEWFNVNAFAQPAPFTFGNVPREMPNLRAPHLNNWDIGIEKWWRWKESLRVQLRGEMFDAWNHTNFYHPDQNLGDPAFGTITQSLFSRDVQFALKVYW